MPLLSIKITQVLSQASRFSVPGQERSLSKDGLASEKALGFHEAMLHETADSALNCLLVMGHSISVNLVTAAQNPRAGRNLRDHLVNSFSTQVKKTGPRE